MKRNTKIVIAVWVISLAASWFFGYIFAKCDDGKSYRVSVEDLLVDGKAPVIGNGFIVGSGVSVFAEAGYLGILSYSGPITVEDEILIDSEKVSLKHHEDNVVVEPIWVGNMVPVSTHNTFYFLYCYPVWDKIKKDDGTTQFVFNRFLFSVSADFIEAE